MPFKISITLESELSTQELADFFGALAKAEAGNVIPLMKVFEVPEAHTIPNPSEFDKDSLHEEELAPPQEVIIPIPIPVPAPKPAPVPEPPRGREVLARLAKTHIDGKTLNKIIHRNNWARGRKTECEMKWGFTKAAAFARIGHQFQDWSLMDGTISTEAQLLNWCKERGFTGTL